MAAGIGRDHGGGTVAGKVGRVGRLAGDGEGVVARDEGKVEIGWYVCMA